MRRTILINFLSIIVFFTFVQKGHTQSRSIGFTAALPWINNYVYHNYDQHESASKSGFTGFGAGIFYQRDKNKFSLNIGFTGDLPSPVGAFDYNKTGIRTNIMTTFEEALYHRNLLNKLNVIAGVNFVSYQFKYTSYVDSVHTYSVTDRTFGLTIGGEYHFTRVFSLALLYRPAVISMNLKQYHHLVSLEARFDINFWRRR